MVNTPDSTIQQKIEDLKPWFHNLHLPDGSQTAPDGFLGDFPAYKWAELADHIPRNLSGRQVLDIGCNAGFYSFELARRGAAVTALDMNPHYLAQARWAAEVYGLQETVRFRRMQVYDLAREDRAYDLVLFLGVFYHLRYPFLALDVVRRITAGKLVFQSLSMPGKPGSVPENLPFDEREKLEGAGWPKMAFIEHRLADDPTNWWVPDGACMEALLRSCGLRIIARPGMETYVCEVDKSRKQWVNDWERDEFLAAAGLDSDAAAGATE
ncbi:MAG: TIGR04290 family methyltransferase [Thermodesulfobacteriota bacterium]